MGDASVLERHVDDPDVVVCSKATAAMGLSVLAVVTGLGLGGVIPAVISLALARQAQAEIASSQGWFTGMRYVQWARRLSWTAMALAGLGVVLIIVFRMLQSSGYVGQNFPHTVD